MTSDFLARTVGKISVSVSRYLYKMSNDKTNYCISFQLRRFVNNLIYVHKQLWKITHRNNRALNFKKSKYLSDANAFVRKRTNCPLKVFKPRRFPIEKWALWTFFFIMLGKIKLQGSFLFFFLLAEMSDFFINL